MYIIFKELVPQAVGEPPLFLAASVLFATVTASRTERGITTPFQLDTPATCESIRMACEDQFTKQVYNNKLLVHRTFVNYYRHMTPLRNMKNDGLLLCESL